MEISDIVVLPNGNIAVTTLVEVAAVNAPYVQIIDPNGEAVHEVLYVSGERARGGRPFMLGTNQVRLSAGPDGRFAIWYPIDNFIEIADSAGVLLARIEGCFPRELQEIYARQFGPSLGWFYSAPQTIGVAFKGPDVIQTATRYTAEETSDIRSGIRLRSYNLKGQELTATDFAWLPLRRHIDWLLFRDDTTMVAFADGSGEHGVYRLRLRTRDNI